MADLYSAEGREAGTVAALRALPSVQRLLEAAGRAGLAAGWPLAALTQALREEVAVLRSAVLSGQAVATGDQAILEAARCRLSDRAAPQLRRVLNATGIAVHTNLGRAPLAKEAIAAAVEAAGSCNLEFDLDTGRRATRAAGVEMLLLGLTGADAALVVNNNAAAMLLALTALAAGGEVVVSRGELVEIGGGFRVPDIIAAGGARLVEVGTTNKTRLADYAAAITPATRILLKIHQSNFRMIGFTAEASLADLAGLASAKNLALVHDLGSGTLTRLPPRFAPAEPTVGDSIVAGSDLVAFSGDKLLGGPQAGLLVGRADILARLGRHPLMRALRADKMTLAALEATLRLHADEATAYARIPVLRALCQSESELACRAEALAGLLAGICAAEVVRSVAHAGGGALPGQEIPSRAIRLMPGQLSADALARSLRAQSPGVAGRIHAGAVLLDVLMLEAGDLAVVAGCVGRALAWAG